MRINLAGPAAHLGTLVRRGVAAVVGRVSWQPPGWMRAVASRLRAHRVAAAFLCVAACAGVGGRYAYLHRRVPVPPHLVHGVVSALEVPELADTLQPSFLRIHFDEGVAALGLVDKPLDSTLVELEPSLPGTWSWEGDRRLVFKPAGEWPADRPLRVTIHPAALSPHVRLEREQLETRTPAFEVRFSRAEFYQNPKDLAVRQVTATLLTTHAVNPAELARHLSVAALGGSPVFGAPAPEQLFSLTPGRHRREFFLRTVPLNLPSEPDTVKLHVAAGLTPAAGGTPLAFGASDKVVVPDLYSFFHVAETSTQIVRDKNGEPHQFLLVETSCQVRSEDLAKSLTLYALPADNPARRTESDAAAPDQADADEPSGDEEERDDEPDDTEAPERVDAPHLPDDWSAAEVDAAALARARRVEVTLVPSATETATTHTFRVRADQPGFLFVKVARDVPAPGGYKLRDDYTNVVPVPVPEKEIAIQGDGGLLALGGERKLSVLSRGVPAIRYEIARVPAAAINQLVSQTRGDFQNPEFRGDYFSEQDFARFSDETQRLASPNPVEANYSTFDFTARLQPAAREGLEREGLFFLTARGWDPQTNKFLRGVQTTRFVLVTDLGVLVKRNADGSRGVFVASLTRGTPVGRAAVTVLARNGVALADAATDDAGRADLPSLGKSPHDSREPVAIVVRRGGDVAFLPYDRADRRLDYSRFPTEGVENHTGHELDAFVFTERGVYRPGDTLHVGVVVKQRDWGGSLDGVPLEAEVIDAREQSAQVIPLTLPASGFVEWSYDTAHDSPTGGYRLNVYLRRDGKRSTLLGSATVQVKEFLPDRLKLDVSLSKTSGPGGHGWVTPDELRGLAVLKNLYGTAAENRLVKARLRLNPHAFAFQEFPDYTFYDRLRENKKDWEGETVALGDQQTAADGTASFDFDLKKFADATYRLTFDAEGFEAEGGRSVEDLAGTLVSPLPFVVGWKADGDLRWVTAGGPDRTVRFVGVDRGLNRVPLENLTVHLAEQRWVSVLTKGPDGNYRYESVCREYPVRDVPFDGAASTLVLPNAEPGNFVVALRDPAGLVLSRLEYTVAGQGAVTRSLEKNAELEIHLSKDQYRAGEEIEVAITAPYAGSGLITLERERVYAHRWFTSKGTGSVQRITVPADFDGTGYVNVSFVRALDSKEIFTSPLSYAVAPFTANMEGRRLHIDLRTAEKSKPGEPLAIRYRTDRPARIAVFAVDQGILQVTKFPPPDPLAFQFRKSALTVRTSQIVDLLLPEFSILRAAQSAGGDGDPGVLNPFRRVTEKPVVYWSGIVDADATERTLTYPVPDYFNGTLTVMAVAVSPDALGSARTASLCRNAFVLTPSVPTLAAPGDEFEVGLTVANGQTGSGPDARVAVQAEPGPGLQIVRGPTEPLHVPEGHEASMVFRVRALERLGSATLGFRAAGGGEDSRVHATLSIRPAMPFRTLVASGHFPGGGTRDVPVNPAILYAEHRHLEANVSALPLGLARGLERYLKEYPHGCSEQITSGAFARLALAGVADFGLTRAEAAAQIAHTVEIERRRQNDAGGFGFWDASKTPDVDFVTAYVMHFLSEAKAEGYPVPDDVFQKGLDALRRASTASPTSLQQARVQAYALYVLTREGVVTTNALLTLRDYLDTSHKDRWPRDLTAVYLAGCWSLLKKDDEARRLIDGYRPGQFDARDRWDFCDGLTADAQYITLLARHFPDRLRRVTAQEFSQVTRPIGEGEFSTLSAAYAVLALKAYSQSLAHDLPRLSVAALLPPKAQEQALTLDGSAGTLLRGTFPAEATGLRFRANGGPGGGPGVFYQTVQSGFERGLPAQPAARGVEVYRDLLDARGLPATRVKLGERVTVRLRLRAARPLPVTNVAVIDLLPGGFEVADDSLPPGVGTAGMDYVDVREDRAVFYGTATGRVHEMTYRIKPTVRGEFTVPPVFAESMYDKKIQAVGVGGHITVTDTK